MTNQQAAAQLRRLAVVYLMNGLEMWQDPMMRAMHWSDAADIRRAATAIEEGRDDDARNQLDSLDTSIHDVLSEDLWEQFGS
jgi:hypothetical protein